MKISISTNFPEVEKRLAQLRRDVGRRALASAVNKTIALAKTQMQREITREFKVSATYVRERLEVTQAKAKGTLAIEATLRGTGKRSANLIRFMEQSVSLAALKRRTKTETRKMLHVQIKRTGGYKPIRGAFIGNKGRTMFIREGKSRLPIKPVQTIDVTQMFNTKRINRAVIEKIKSRFPDIFAHEASFYMERFGRR